jgi:hypothetical protein
MQPANAENWVTTSALVVIVVYGYRRITESGIGKGVKSLTGSGEPSSFGQFITAWGFTFFVISLLAQASPGFGGSVALLVMTADLLTNAQAVFGDALSAEGSAAEFTNKSATALAPTNVAGKSPLVGASANATTGTQGTTGLEPMAQ